MKSCQKIIAMLLAICMMLSSLAVLAVATDDAADENTLTLAYDELVNQGLAPDALNNRLMGDYNNDRVIGADDARIALRTAVSLEKHLSKEQLFVLDVDQDAQITAADARSILRMSVGLDEIREITVTGIPAPSADRAFTVSFDSNGGSPVADITVLEGKSISEPANPTKEGFVFDGWYLNDSDETSFNFDIPIFHDMKLFARWLSNEDLKQTYSITFVLNDGSDGAYDYQTVKANERVTRPDDPVKDDYIFTGWYTEPAAINEFSFSTRIKDDFTLYAGWKTAGSLDSIVSTSEGGGTIYSITDISIEESASKTTINVNEQSVLVLRFYEEDSDTLIDTISTLTPEYCELEIVTIPIEKTLPKYFIVTADLYDFDGNQRCDTYKSIKNTLKYEQFQQKTVSDFEDRVVLNFDDDETNNFGVLGENVISVVQENGHNILTKEIKESDDDEIIIYTISDADTQVASLKSGDVIYAKDSEGNDCLFKIGTIEKSNENYVISPSQENEMTDFYDYLKVDMHIEQEDDEQANPRRDTYAPRNIEVIDVDVKPSATISPINLDWEPNDWLKLNFKAQGSVNAEVEMAYDVVIFGKDQFSCSIKATTELEISGSVTATFKDNEDEVKAAMKERKFPKDFDLPKLRIPTPIAGLDITVTTGVPVEFKIEGSFELTFKTTTVSGFKYDTASGRQPYDKKERSFEVKADGKAEVKIGPKLEIGVSFLHDVVEMKIYAQAGVKATATATLEFANITTAESKHACGLCIDVEAKWFVEVGIKLKYNIIKDVLSGTVFDIKLFEIEGQILFGGLPTIYFSLIHSADSVFGSIAPHIGFGECPNKQYRTTIKLIDENGTDITGTTVSVYKENGQKVADKNSTFVDYLYDGKYTIKTKIDGTNITKSFVVSGNAQEIQLHKNSGDGSISGLICDAGTNNPIAEATVLITKDRMVVGSLKSDADGKYRITLPDGVYCVKITKDGYITSIEYVIVKDATDKYLQTNLMIPVNGKTMGGISGRVVDAVTGNPVKNVTIRIYKGWDNQGYGDYVNTIKTDSNGLYKYEMKELLGITIGLQAGNYSFVLTKTDYATAYANLTVLPGVDNPQNDISMSPTATTSGNYRIILTWGSTPSDLDSHFIGVVTSGSSDHIFYANDIGYSGNLDRDDTDSYGPETITVTSFDSLVDGFTYCVHDFTNRDSTNSKVLSNSNAVVKLYKGNTELETYNVPTDQEGTVWRVFSIDASGNITDLNQFYYESNEDLVK